VGDINLVPTRHKDCHTVSGQCRRSARLPVHGRSRRTASGVHRESRARRDESTFDSDAGGGRHRGCHLGHKPCPCETQRLPQLSVTRRNGRSSFRKDLRHFLIVARSFHIKFKPVMTCVGRIAPVARVLPVKLRSGSALCLVYDRGGQLVAQSRSQGRRLVNT
jgi:hypothetical protein